MRDCHPENPFWNYSVSVYGMPGVTETCLELQNEYGVDVNILLYGAWLASRGVELNKCHLKSLDQAVSAWREHVIRPLRSLREELPKEGPGAEVRQKMLEIELEAERREQDLLYFFWQENGLFSVTTPAIEVNLRLVAEHFSPDVDATLPLLSRLAEQFNA